MVIHHIIANGSSRDRDTRRGEPNGLGQVSRRQFWEKAGQAALSIGTALAFSGCGGETEAQRTAKRSEEAVEARLKLLRDKHGAQNFGKYEVEYEAALYSDMKMPERISNQRKILESMCDAFLGDKNIPESIKNPNGLWINLIRPWQKDPGVLNDFAKRRLQGRVNEAVLQKWITDAHRNYLNDRFVKPTKYDGLMPDANNLHNIGSCNREIQDSSLDEKYKTRILNDERYFDAVNNANIGTVNTLAGLIDDLASKKPDDAKVENFLQGLKKALYKPTIAVDATNWLFCKTSGLSK